MTVLQDFLKGIAPVAPELVFKGAGFVVLVVIVALFVRIVWKAATDNVTKAIAAWLNEHRVTELVLLFGLLIGASAALGFFVTSAAMAILGMGAAFLTSRGRLNFRMLHIAAAGLVAVTLSASVEDMIKRRMQRAEDDRVTVYVVFPFTPAHGDDPNTRLSLSQSLHRTVKDIVGSGTDVHVEPAALATMEQLNAWADFPEAVKRLSSEGVRPDILLMNSGALHEDRVSNAQFVTLLLRPRMPRPKAEGAEFDDMPYIREIGRLGDISYMAIRATLTLAERLRDRPNGLPKEAEIAANAAKKYVELLEGELTCPDECVAAKKAAAASGISFDELVDVVRMYPADRTSDLETVVREKESATKAKDPTKPIQPPPAEIPVPADATPAPGVGT